MQKFERNTTSEMFSNEEINRHNYQYRFQEMEAKIRKCELERTQLEQRFTQLMRERQECEKATERSMKLKYKRMMELERQRAERNESLLRMLHKIDQQAASLAAKTDRLKMLKTQYETYLIRSWSSQRALPPSPAPSICSHQIYPPAPPQPSYYRNTESPKSDFVRYLSDLTHTQTAIHNPIPPPTALSNYIASQPSSSSAWSRDPYSRGPSEVIPQPSYNFPASSLNPSIPETPRHRPPSTKPQLSNEEFIQYIDNEILKAPDIPLVDTPPPPMVAQLPNITVVPPSKVSSPPPAAYLEDVTTEEEAKPSTDYDEDKAYVIEDVAEAVDKLSLYDALEQPKQEDTEITQRWERIVEVNSNEEPVKKKEEVTHQESLKPSYEEIIEHPIAQVAPESVKAELIEEPYQEPFEQTQISSASEEAQQETNVTYEQQTPATSEEVQPEYQPNYSSEADYQQYPTTVEQEYQAPVDYNYQYTPKQPAPTETYSNQPTAEDQTYWTAARQAVKTKTITALGQSRTPETIEEVANNGEAIDPVIEKRSTPSGSKRSSPMGEVVSTTEVHQTAPEPAPTEEQPTVDTTQYDYSQYPQEYDPAAEQQQDYQQYQQDGSEQQYYEYQEQDPSQAQQQYQEYAEGVDPNQYQQATEYPGPTQYVFEQGYYDQAQPTGGGTEDQQQYDPNQQAYYDQSQQPVTAVEGDQQYDPNQQAYYDPNAEQQQQQYYDEGQAQDPTQYDQSQDYGNYEQSQGQEAAMVEAAEQDPTVKEPTETDSSSKVEDATPVAASEEVESSPSLLFATTSEESEKGKGSVEDQQKKKIEGSPRGDGEGKDTTTVSSVNDESDFDFSTQ